MIKIISNGYGEDLIGSTLLAALKKEYPTQKYDIFPLVGNGHHYTKQNHTVAFNNPVFPSGGFIRSTHDLYTDIKAGLLTHTLSQYNTIKKNKPKLTIAIGDFFCLSISQAGNKGPTMFFPTAKSDTFMPHSALEYWLIKKWATHTYPRDQLTTTSFQKKSIPASYFGNPMMDNLTTTETIPTLDPTKPIIGILPGSREEAYTNFESICNFIKKFPLSSHQYVVAKAPSLSKDKLLDIKKDLPIQISDQFLSILNQSNVIIGLAGTANEQAVFLNKSVICFEGTGPQTSKKRFEEQEKLLGKKLHFIRNATAERICTKIEILLKEESLSTEVNTNQEAATQIARHIKEICPL